MNLSVGIVGLPNVGKSTTFNALTKAANAQAANYPFCTIEPNKAIVEVPDNRLKELAKIVNPEKILSSSVEFVDIAGLVKGASKGEGLGNKFLSNIREVEIILHLTRCFDDGEITHVEDSINPIRDIEIIESELILADIEQLNKKIDKLNKKAKSDKDAKKELEIAQEMLAHLDNLEPISNFKDIEDSRFISLNKELRFLSAKKVIYIANVGDDDLANDNDYVKEVKKYANDKNQDVITICAKLEEELVDMNDDEAIEFLNDFGINESGLNKVIRNSFNELGLISYFTAGVKEVRSWTINDGDKAPRAAAAIHNDFEKGFIKAEVIAYDDFIASNGEQNAKENGKLRLEGKEYIVQSGDVIHFKFNV
jgi:GTP-binding protein YchF